MTFVTIAQSPFVIRIVYQGTYCLELNLLSDGLISIRDAAYGRFDRMVVVSEYTPTGGLKVCNLFLEKSRSIAILRSLYAFMIS